MPSQSLSWPSQISVAGFTPPVHAPQTPLRLQVDMPNEQRPVSMPQVRVWPFTHMQPSFMLPSQSSSTIAASQTSVAGPTPPVHEPQLPLLHVDVPATQAPTSVPQACVSPSSRVP